MFQDDVIFTSKYDILAGKSIHSVDIMIKGLATEGPNYYVVVNSVLKIYPVKISIL